MTLYNPPTPTRRLPPVPPAASPVDLTLALVNARIRSVEDQIKTLQAELRELGQIRKELQKEEN